MSAGSVTIDDDGNATGDGDALVLYNALLAAETAVSPLVDPEERPLDFEGTAEQWRAVTKPILLRVKRSWARLATYHAGAFFRDTKVRVTNVTGNISADDEFVAVGSHAGPITLTVPASLPVGRIFAVKDAVGEGLAKPITIQFSGGETTDGGGSSLPTSIAYQCLEFVKITSSLWSVKSTL